MASESQSCCSMVIFGKPLKCSCNYSWDIIKQCYNNLNGYHEHYDNIVIDIEESDTIPESFINRINRLQDSTSWYPSIWYSDDDPLNLMPKLNALFVDMGQPIEALKLGTLYAKYEIARKFYFDYPRIKTAAFIAYILTMYATLFVVSVSMSKRLSSIPSVFCSMMFLINFILISIELFIHGHIGLGIGTEIRWLTISMIILCGGMGALAYTIGINAGLILYTLPMFKSILFLMRYMYFISIEKLLWSKHQA